MAYRASDDRRSAARDEQRRARDELDQLATEGATQAATQAAESGRREGRKQRRAAAKVNARDRAVLREAVLGGSWAFIVTILVSVAVGCGGGSLLIAFSAGRQWMVGLGIAAVVLGAAVAWCSRYVIGGRAIAAEERFVAGLGFPIDGYFRVLSLDPSDCHLELTIEVVADVPEEDTARGLAGLVKAELHERGDRRLVLRSPRLSTDGGDGPSHNRGVHAWLRGAVERVLVPLHRGYPIARVGLKRS